MANLVFPRRNLPGGSDSWGREVENHLVSGVWGLQADEQDFNNSSRAISGTLSTLSRQSNELASRTTIEVPIPSITFAGRGDIYPPPSRTVTSAIPPGEGGPREALIFITGDSRETGDPSLERILTFSFEGTQTYRARVERQRGAPLNWDAEVWAAFPARIPSGGGELSVTAVKIRALSDTNTWTVDNLKAVVHYGAA